MEKLTFDLFEVTSPVISSNGEGADKQNYCLLFVGEQVVLGTAEEGSFEFHTYKGLCPGMRITLDGKEAGQHLRWIGEVQISKDKLSDYDLKSE
jgi:hypothetical protein